MSINLSISSLFKKEKDSSSNKSLIESDIEEKGVINCINHVKYLNERLEYSSFPEESFHCLTTAGPQLHLMKGVVCKNNPITVLCPILAKGIVCSRGNGMGISRTPYRPKLLMKNHGNPNLQLWRCEGCPNILLKVNLHETSLT